MKYGDLSREAAASIGVRFEGVIKTQEGKLNRAAKSFLERLEQLDVMLYVITSGDYRKCLAFLVKWNVPYNKVISVDSLFEIADVCREQEFISYYDADKDIVYNVKSRGKERVAAEIWDKFEVA